jgi:two-component system response regulator HydG
MNLVTRSPAAPSATRDAVRTTGSDPFSSLGLVGDSRAMQLLRAEVRRYAPRNATVLVFGETGSGKELVARALHLASPRVPCPFVAVNVATLRRELIASELFGHERGAFTGALSRHRGAFEQAHTGTLLFDEIGELALDTQADLLRVLETGEVRPVGSDRSYSVNVRLIASTHCDLAAMVEAGRFRQDLYYRLHVLPVVTPPLRERLDDVPALVAHLLHGLRVDVGERRLTEAALRQLQRYPWPGNVRQLLNVLRRATARTDANVIDANAIDDALAVEPRARLAMTLPAHSPLPLTREDIDAALRKTMGNVARAARHLGVPRSTLRNRVHAQKLPATASAPRK